MKKHLILILAIVLATTYTAQTTGHKKKHHKQTTEQVVQKADTSKKIVTPPIDNGPTLKELQDARINRGLITIGCVVFAIILLSVIYDKRKKNKLNQANLDRIEEENRKKAKIIEEETNKKTTIIEEINQAYSKKEILDENYSYLKTNFNQFTFAQLNSDFTVAKNKKSHLDYLNSKYSEQEVTKILNHEYWIGMTEEQLVDAKGKPSQIDLEQLKTKTKKIYIYGNKSSGDVFNFVDGVLERFKDR